MPVTKSLDAVNQASATIPQLSGAVVGILDAAKPLSVDDDSKLPVDRMAAGAYSTLTEAANLVERAIGMIRQEQVYQTSEAPTYAVPVPSVELQPVGANPTAAATPAPEA